MNYVLVKSIKRVIKSTTILGRDVSEEDNVTKFVFFSSGFLGVFTTVYARVASRTLGYDIKFRYTTISSFTMYC